MARHLADARVALGKQVASITAVRSAECKVECDHCGAPNAVEEGVASCTCGECGKTFGVEW